MKNGLSIIVRNEQDYIKACRFVGVEYCYVKWAPQMAEHETGLVVWAKKKTNRSAGSIGCAENQREDRIRTVEFKDYFL